MGVFPFPMPFTGPPKFGTSFTPLSLFAANEQGVWYDPSDLTTLFQDAAGTTPVTGLEQPVGLMLDKSGRGNHASQSTAASRPVLSARVNLLTYTEQFDNAAWTKNSATVTANTTATTDPLGGSTADKLVETAVNDAHYASQSVTYTTGVTYTISCCAKAAERSVLYLRLGNTAVFGAETAAYFDLSAGTVGTVLNSATCAITSLGNGWYRCSVTKAATATGTVVVVGPYVAQSDGTNSYLGDITKGIYIWGADLRVSNDGVGLPSYQRVGAATSGSSTASGTADYDSTGFPVYLRFDGTDDSAATGSIDFTSTDKMSVVAGVRKLSDASLGMIFEAGSDWTVAGGFGVYINTTSPFGYSVGVSGTGDNRRDYLSLAAPRTDVATLALSTVAANSDAAVSARFNGAAVSGASGVTANSTGNFGNLPFYIGSRGGSSLRFNGRLHGLLVIGRALTTTEITNTETWMNQRTRAF